MGTTYVLHASASGYGIRAVAADLVVWQAADASPAGVSGLVTFLNTHAGHLPAHEVRAMLAPVSDLPDEPTDEPAERAS